MSSQLQHSLAQRCSFSADIRGDDLSGTAPANARFLLIEQPGSWGRIAVEQSQLDRGVGTALAIACGQSRTRPLLIRRPGRSAPPVRKRWYLATTTPGAPSMRTGTVDTDDELLALLDADAPGQPCEHALYAVCTHGRHDACCAIRGRPVARKLGLELGEGAWEVSHLGGDRFAGNLLVLPHGLYYGRVDRDNVELIVAATERGEVVPEFFRGCSAYGPAAQAAQAFARGVSGDNRIDAHTPRHSRRTSDQVWQVTLEGIGAAAGGGGDPWEVTVERRQTGAPELLTCAAKARLAPPEWVLLDLAIPSR